MIQNLYSNPKARQIFTSGVRGAVTAAIVIIVGKSFGLMPDKWDLQRSIAWGAFVGLSVSFINSLWFFVCKAKK
jgi:hypothetical protein